MDRVRGAIGVEHVETARRGRGELLVSGPARFAHEQRVTSHGLDQLARLRRLAGTVDSLDRYEQAGHPPDATIARHLNAVVTGGAGFIGSNLADALTSRGDEVWIVDDISTGKRENAAQAVEAGARLVETDLRDAAAL